MSYLGPFEHDYCFEDMSDSIVDDFTLKYAIFHSIGVDIFDPLHFFSANLYNSVPNAIDHCYLFRC